MTTQSVGRSSGARWNIAVRCDVAAKITKETHIVLGWALIFFLLAIVAGYFGFFGLAGMAASIAKVLFLIFLVLLVVSFIVRAVRGRSVM